MVIRRRTRAFLMPLFLYVFAIGAVAYFVRHAHSGARGTEAKQTLKIKVAEMESELKAIHSERMEWEHRISLLKADQIDRDLLEERARITLGMVHRNDVVIMGR